MRKKLKYALNTVLEVASNTRCKDLHHPKKHQHKADEVCPAEYHLMQQVQIIREYMKEQEI